VSSQVGISAPTHRPIGRAVLRLALLWALGAVATSSLLPITDGEEVYYAVGGMQMRESGQWLVPTYNGVIRFEKPFLQYALVAASYAALGYTSLAARAVSTISIGLTAWALWWHTKDEKDEDRVACVAMWLACVGVLAYGTVALPDALWTCGIVTAIVGMWRSFRTAGLPAGCWLLLAASAVGCAILTKGAMAVPWVVLCGTTGAVFAGWAAWRRSLCGGTAVALLGLIVAAPWNLYMWTRFGDYFIWRTLRTENIERFITEAHGQWSPWLYAFVLPLLCLPWLPVLVSRALSRVRYAPAERAAMCAACIPLVALWLSRGQQARYVLPVLPFILACAVTQSNDSPRLDRLLVWILRGAACLVGVRVAVARVEMWPERTIAVAALLVAALVLWRIEWLGRRQRLILDCATAAVALSAALVACKASRVTGAEFVAGIVNRMVPSINVPVCVDDSVGGSVAFYARRAVHEVRRPAEALEFLRASAPGALCIVGGTQDVRAVPELCGLVAVQGRELSILCKREWATLYGR